MRIYVDDERRAPTGWQQVRSPQRAIELLQTNAVREISLGNDSRGTGDEVLHWIQEAVSTCDFDPPMIVVHTVNPAARNRLTSSIRSIQLMTECCCGAD
ncbi:cyclic-phosphate processing receiver domain-containing protein [Gimesia maris]|uniref:cyclic-phosphate processing receiver domain-containing protein n=1 Tax=Gimesia maris TaxID=122 RepID=UPI003A8E96E6